ncbi:MAG: hypothetical protein IJG13_19265 [Kiritimatiellae bacterium]|nr:hypothetical protein [Kiritimatiellia bacterium]MBQ3341483.1 hypothetical protein [Kiritimatiellia bacterium]MBQ6330916.1 hypothetical protein [Kiritimatiellia bacterium]
MKKLLVMMGGALLVAIAADAAANSCIVSGSTNRTALVTSIAIAINSELDTRPPPQVRLDRLNLRTDAVHGYIITFR